MATSLFAMLMLFKGIIFSEMLISVTFHLVLLFLVFLKFFLISLDRLESLKGFA